MFILLSINNIVKGLTQANSPKTAFCLSYSDGLTPARLFQ